MDRQILSAIQIESDEVRLLTAEYFNDGLFILDTQIEKCDGLQGRDIIDKNKVCNSIINCLQKTNTELKTNITKILLAIPSYRVNVVSELFSQNFEENHIINENDIKSIINSGYSCNLGADYEIVNVMCHNFSVNGLSQRKAPIGVKTNKLDGELQLIGCDKLLTYSYANAIENCQLELIDVCLDQIAAAKETALLENAYQNYVVAINIEKKQSYFTLAYKGNVIGLEVIDLGYESLALKVSENYKIPLRKSEEIIFKFLNLGKDELTDMTVYVWRNKDNNYQISEKELFEIIKPELEALCDEYALLCKDIFAYDNVNVQISGKGSVINGLSSYLQKRFGKNVNEYVPNTLGAFGACWTVALGLIYNYLEHNSGLNSINLLQFEEGLKIVKKEKQTSFTGKIIEFVSSERGERENG